MQRGSKTQMEQISTIVLNWNRAALLEKTLESWFATVTGPAELIVVDNASTDESRTVIERFPVHGTILLDENIGGEAVNAAREQAGGELIHICENDQILLGGWADHVRDCFAAFPSLGQLSLHGVVPTDDETWEIKPGHLRFSRGKILYQAEHNIGTSSILPAAVFTRDGIRVHNLPPRTSEAFKFPDDGRLSPEVKALGLWCAWSDRYWVRNLGHEIEEFERNPDYYRDNYASKPWLGIGGWQRRVAATQGRPRLRRHSIALPAAVLQPEKTAREVAGKPAQLWSMLDGYTAETEVLDTLHTVVRLIKPEYAIETGTWLGYAAIAIGTAMRDNGFGRLTTIELDAEVAQYAHANIAAAGVSDWVQIMVGNSLDHRPEHEIQFALLDSDIAVRQEEFRHLYDSLANGALVAFHDTGPQHGGLADQVRELMNEGRLEGCFFQTPRGLFIGTARRPPAAQATAAASEADVAALQARIAALEASTSWRVTGPLRALARLIGTRGNG
jgi:predicted O-methyltransferase YrrM